jgi:hypothetical protein
MFIRGLAEYHYGIRIYKMYVIINLALFLNIKLKSILGFSQ